MTTTQPFGFGSDASLADIKSFSPEGRPFSPLTATPQPMPMPVFGRCNRFTTCWPIRKSAAYDDNRRRNLLDDPLETAREIWQTYIKTVL